MNDEQIKEVMRLGELWATYAWKACSHGADETVKSQASRAALEAYLRTIGEPENVFPLNPNGASKWAHLQKHDGAEAIGVVFRTGSGSVGSLVDGRVVWADWLAHPNGSKPESVNAELLEALKSAKNGLEWYQDAHPESASECDNKAMQEIDAAIARAESAIEGSHKHLEPWQPIETAPHDEVLLLACEFDGPGDWRIKCGYFDDDLGGWKVWGASWVPTRWATIPAPPNLSDAARRDQTPAKVSPCADQQIIDYVKGVYAFLESTSPAGFAWDLSLRGCNSRHGGIRSGYPCTYRMRTTDPGCTGCVERDEDQPAEAGHEND